MAIFARKNKHGKIIGYGVHVYEPARNGKPGRKRWVGTFPTRKEAKEAERQHETRRPGKKITVDEFGPLWLEQYKRPARSTQITYRHAVKVFVENFTGWALEDITRLDARVWANKAGSYTARVVRSMYTDAINDGLVEHNPFSNMRAPQSKGRKHIKAPSAQEIAYFAQVAMLELDPVTGPQISSLILVGAYTGLRPGELLALDWDNVNFEEGLLHVRHTLDPFGEKKPPKNGKARTVVLPLIPVQALQSLPVQIDQRNVFANAHGGRLTKTSLYYYWNTVRAASGLKFTPHVLRHFCATYLIDEGAKNGMCTDFDASIQLGHTDGGRLVKELYGHPDEVRVRERVRAVLDAASGDSQVPDDEEWVANG